MRSIEKAVLALAVAALMGVLPGCGSNRTGAEGSGAVAGPFGVDADNLPYVGADQCVICHDGEDAVADYLVSKHVVHSHDVDATMGRDGCLACHDPIGDGRLLEGLIGVDDVPLAGLAAVTCEACHGAGGQHYGLGPIPIATPDYTVCGKCHSAAFATTTAGHTAFTEADNILEDYEASPHAQSLYRGDELEDPERLLLWGTSSPNDAICVKCHTDEGGRQYRDVSTWEDLATMGETNPIQCRTCHNAHNPGELLHAAIGTTFSAEYNTCSNCHQRHDAQLAADPGTDDGASGDLIYHATRWRRVISSTHYDDPTTTNIVEGYSMDPANARVCRDCHNVHSADLTINEQWARSGHGGELRTIKEEAAAAAIDETFAQAQAVRAAGTDTSSWAQQVWTDDAQASCQRCHTATGGKNFMAGSAAYHDDMTAFIAAPETNPSPNDFSYLQAGAQEMLFCWACHTDNTGALRLQDEVHLIDLDNAIFATIASKGKSTGCIGCHGGSANSSTMADLAAADRSSDSLVHHMPDMPAAGLLFSAQTHSGYEFAGKNYTDKEYFAHNKIGLDTGAGPCVSCHMVNHPVDDGDSATDADAAKLDHSLQALGEDDEATPIIMNQVLCKSCHLADTMTRAALDAKKAGFAAAKALLQGYVQNAVATPNHWGTDLTLPANLAGVPVEAYGAAQNYQFLANDPGAYVHNSLYVKRLIFDSINLLQHGDTSALTLDLTAYPAAYDYLVTWATADPKPPIGAMTRP